MERQLKVLGEPGRGVSHPVVVASEAITACLEEVHGKKERASELRPGWAHRKSQPKRRRRRQRKPTKQLLAGDLD